MSFISRSKMPQQFTWRFRMIFRTRATELRIISPHLCLFLSHHLSHHIGIAAVLLILHLLEKPLIQVFNISHGTPHVCAVRLQSFFQMISTFILQLLPKSWFQLPEVVVLHRFRVLLSRFFLLLQHIVVLLRRNLFWFLMMVYIDAHRSGGRKLRLHNNGARGSVVKVRALLLVVLVAGARSPLELWKGWAIVSIFVSLIDVVCDNVTVNVSFEFLLLIALRKSSRTVWVGRYYSLFIDLSIVIEPQFVILQWLLLFRLSLLWLGGFRIASVPACLLFIFLVIGLLLILGFSLLGLMEKEVSELVNGGDRLDVLVFAAGVAQAALRKFLVTGGVT